MNALYYKPEELYPGILLDKDAEKFLFYGKSCPSNTFELFSPVMEWFKLYSQNPLKSTVLEINFSYFNTSTAKFLFKVMTILEPINERGFEVKVIWYYNEDDLDMKENGEEFDDVVDLNFEIVSVCETYVDEDDAYFNNILRNSF